MSIQEIKAYMKQHKISYAKLAEMTGLSVSTITKIFGGFAKYPRIDTMEAIEHALGLDKNQITEAERAAGWSDTAKVSVTPIEFDMLQVFREIGEKYGEESQKAAISMLENTLGLKK